MLPSVEAEPRGEQIEGAHLRYAFCGQDKTRSLSNKTNDELSEWEHTGDQ